MVQVWLGALLVVAGVLQMAYQAIWIGRMSDPKQHDPAARNTLEPRRSPAGFTLKANWPGIVLILIGGALLLTGNLI